MNHSAARLRPSLFASKHRKRIASPQDEAREARGFQAFLTQAVTQSFTDARLLSLGASLACLPFIAFLAPELRSPALVNLGLVAGLALASLVLTRALPMFLSIGILFVSGAAAVFLGGLMGASMLMAGLFISWGCDYLSLTLSKQPMSAGKKWAYAGLITLTMGALAYTTFALFGKLEIVAAAVLLALPGALTSLLTLKNHKKSAENDAQALNSSEFSAPSTVQAAFFPLMEAVRDTLLITDHRGDVLLQAGAAHDFGALQGRAIFDQMLLTDRPTYLKAIAEAALDARDSNVIVRIASKQGKYSAYEAFVQPKPPKDGSSKQAVLSLRAISEAERKSRAEKRDREHARAAEFQAFLHNVNTPLTAISGFAELLASKDLDAWSHERVQEYGGLIHVSAIKLQKQIEDLVHFAQNKIAEEKAYQAAQNSAALAAPLAPDNLIQLQAAEALEAGNTQNTTIAHSKGEDINTEALTPVQAQAFAGLKRSA